MPDLMRHAYWPLLLAALFLGQSAKSEPIAPSPSWANAMPAGPAVAMRITPEYAALVARDAFFWTWPLVNVYNRRLAFEPLTDFGLSGGIVPAAPHNRLTMLSDYIAPEERIVACPNQDVVYGNGILALDKSSVVIQVPDFGDRFWVYQIVDLRTDSFADLGKMYGTKPGFYLLVGPNWRGEIPKLLRAKRPEAILDRHEEQRAQVRRRRLAYHLCPGRQPRARQGGQLAAIVQRRRLLALYPKLLGRRFTSPMGRGPHLPFARLSEISQQKIGAVRAPCDGRIGMGPAPI
jgi:Protein of unknown function (DUF1254)